MGGSAMSEGLYGLGCGFLFGITSAIVGQPLDSIKTKMQAQASYRTGGMLHTFSDVLKREGVIGLYRGILPPLLGSSIFRSIQFGVYNASWSALGQSVPVSKTAIPMTNGLEPRVLAAGFASATIRSFVECPLELIKVRQMTGQPWQVNQLYQGFSALWLRTCGLMVTFFVIVDYAVRFAPDLVTTPYVGPFLKGGVASTLSWALVWPFEVLKNQIQANDSGPKTIGKRFFYVLKEQGVKGLYRGFLPGASRSLIANGASMLMFDYCQQARHTHQQPDFSEL